ncbi:MAG TPA: hypothetical protein ENL41_01850, partial [candidate division WOR-3 bacterium]|nr:hypothetical protein [candidate division WOR-3 bacterium]
MMIMWKKYKRVIVFYIIIHFLSCGSNPFKRSVDILPGSDDMAFSVLEAHDRGFIILGVTYFHGRGDIYLIRTDSSGDIKWYEVFGGKGDVVGKSILNIEDGYIIAGWTRLYETRGYDILLLKADLQGKVMWQRNFGGRGDEMALSLVEAADGGYVIAGWTNSTGNGQKDVSLIKTDDNGNIVWHKTLGSGKDEVAYSICRTGGGEYIVAGWTSSFSENKDVYVLKVDRNGKLIWQNIYGGEKDDGAYSVKEVGGEYIVTGWTKSYGAARDDVLLLKIDTEGNLLWRNTFGGRHNESGVYVNPVKEGGYIIAGWTDSEGKGGDDVYLVKTNSRGDMLWYKTFGWLGND